MARATTKAATHTGLYAMLAAREERAVANGGILSNPDTGTSYIGTPARLAKFRAGLPVDDLFAGSLPQSARQGMTVTALTYATVTADGAVTFRSDPAQFCIENGL
jgi:hypothetical protein